MEADDNRCMRDELACEQECNSTSVGMRDDLDAENQQRFVAVAECRDGGLCEFSCTGEGNDDCTVKKRCNMGGPAFVDRDGSGLEIVSSSVLRSGRDQTAKLDGWVYGR